MQQVTEILKIRRKVLAELAFMAFTDNLGKHQIMEGLVEEIATDSGQRYRCCVHKERAVLQERIKTALGQPPHSSLEAAAEAALAGLSSPGPIVTVLPEACDQCRMDKFLVTNACRNCVAHSCIASCPRQAISVVHNQAVIEQDKCRECGLCKKACGYGAIVEVSRPCERACAVEAIRSGEGRIAEIDYERCVECGQCINACPFGAISQQSALVQVIGSIKTGKRVYAILAPAFAGQFGPRIQPGQIVNGLKTAGFFAVQEAALGADIVTVQEVKELLERVPHKQDFLTTSCCPAYVNMVSRHMPEVMKHVSSTVSPMIAAGKVIKASDSKAVTVFIGPCPAKKGEARNYPDAIDYVLTFEELEALFTGADINLSELTAEGFITAASGLGTGFAQAGGVTEAVLAAAEEFSPAWELKACQAAGLPECRRLLREIQTGKTKADFFEGMACSGGCISGPGSLQPEAVLRHMLGAVAKTAACQLAADNSYLEEAGAVTGWQVRRQAAPIAVQGLQTADFR